MKKTSVHIVLGLALVLSSGYALEAFAQTRPATLVKQRQAAMTLQGKYYYPIRAMAQGKMPYDASIVARNAIFLDSLSKMPWDGFAASTKDIKSSTVAAAFTDTAKFQDAQKALETEVTKLAALTKGGTEAAIKTQILAVDKACSSCHDTFRERE